MDQDNTKGQDKRNWRERLGIGAQAQVPGTTPGSRDLPKNSNDARREAAPSAARPAASATRPPVSRATPTAPRVPAAPVKPAPMAPRANPKPLPPVAPDKLAERLRSQREASTKMAEQRVQVAKQRGEAVAPVPQQRPAALPPVPGAPKPKFTFAEEGEAKAAAAAPQRPAAPPPFPPVGQNQQPQLPPARAPLGGAPQPGVPGFQARPQPPSYQPQQTPAFPGAGNLPPGFPPAYGQPYRPIDPATGYAPPPGYVPPPQRGFNMPPQQGGFPQANGPRLNVPARPTTGLNANFQQPQQDFGQPNGSYTPPLRNSRPPLRGPVTPQDGEYEDDGYQEVPTPRAIRPSSTDYQQAYREAEYGYEEEAPRSKAPWILAGLVLLAIAVALGGAWAYTKYGKPLINGQATTRQIPAINPPDAPAKVEAEQPAAPQQNQTATPTKKQIYDRIIGDQEVIGGEVSAPPETPAAVPDPTPPAAQTAPQPAGGDDAAPLPIPPPPGGAGDQQGSLAPASEKQTAETIIPAAGASQAAVAVQGTPEIAPPGPVADAPSAETPPAPGEVDAANAVTPPLAPEVTDPGSEKITDAAEPAPAPVKKKIEKKKPVASKDKLTPSNLGSKPVVLVPPSKAAKAKAKVDEDTQIATAPAQETGGLFGDSAEEPAPTPAVPATSSAKKKRTLADLFNKAPDNTASQATQPVDVATAEPIAPVQSKPAKKVIAPQPDQPVQQASTGGDFIVQLASFRSRAEASTEFARLKAKNGGAVGRFSPIISEANVGGSTRFRLSVGRMATKAEADAVCSSLFASGERDCLVKKR